MLEFLSVPAELFAYMVTLEEYFGVTKSTVTTKATIAAMTQVIAICSFFFHIFPRTTSKSTSIFFPCVLL